MKNLTRRDFLRWAAMGAGGALLAACAPKATVEPQEPEEKAPEQKAEEEPTPVPAEPVTIVYCSWGSEQKWASEQRCHQSFYDAHPEIDVEFVGMAFGPYWQRILTSFAGGDPVDMFRMNYWKSHAYYARGVILCLDEHLEADGINFEETFVKPHGLCVYQGKCYATPRGATGNHVIYYNRDMFDEVGVEWPDNTPDWTWDDLLETAKQFTNVTGDPATDVWGFDTSKIMAFNGAQEFVWGWGGQLFNEDHTKCLINTPETIEGLQWMVDLRAKHGVAPYPAQLPEGMGDAFLVQKVAMNQQGGFMINIYKTIEDFDWGIATVPAGPIEHVAYSQACASVITQPSEHHDACWEYLKHINSEENVKCEALEGLWPPNLDAVMNSDWYLTRDTPPYNMAPTVPGLLVRGQSQALSPYADQVRTVMSQEFDPVWLGDADVADVAPIVEEKVNEILATEEIPELS